MSILKFSFFINSSGSFYLKELKDTIQSDPHKSCLIEPAKLNLVKEIRLTVRVIIDGSVVCIIDSADINNKMKWIWKAIDK